ncbi:hypothetical protein LSH36_58g22023 [Paralvinella palmiformis]|uniref:Epoxide hydrolase n=1 Tax=Paralvinella palmiformis TaxID=53620 RepID=A0AAD9NE33_9ANNE|nr:hypothetical protein LSH36_58g22023 [Paralvinella palmiformis]
MLKLGPRQYFWIKNRDKLPERIRLHYVAKGPDDKPLMLFLHGFPEFWYSWRFQLKEFSKEFSAFTQHSACKDHQFATSARNAKQTVATVTDSFNHAAEASSWKPAGDDPVLAVQMNTICSNVHLLVNPFSGLIDLQQKNCWDVLSHGGFYQGYHAQNRTCSVLSIVLYLEHHAPYNSEARAFLTWFARSSSCC